MNRALREGTSILVGQSGVGKSSLVRALLPDLDIRIGAISSATGRGRHTTTAATLYPLPCGGQLIDSPGVRDFALPPLEPGRIAQGFPELRTHAHGCRFPDCRHTVEPGCAVREAVDNALDACEEGGILPDVRVVEEGADFVVEPHELEEFRQAGPSAVLSDGHVPSALIARWDRVNAELGGKFLGNLVFTCTAPGFLDTILSCLGRLLTV